MGFEAYGRSISASVIEQGLRELNPDIHFDMPNSIEDAHFVLQTPDRAEIDKRRQGIYFSGRYVCAMDRPICPELKVWNLEDGFMDISVADADKYDDVVTTYVEILTTDPFYNEALFKAQQKHDKFTIDQRGKVFAWTYMVPTKVRGDVVQVGWRHTFANLIAMNIPGVTQRTLEEKFGVDLSLTPKGEDAELALTEE